jgi:hypothetical protein
MTELDQAPATTATETADRSAAGEQRPGSHDAQARYPNAISTADTDPGYYDGDVQAALAADTTPTRQQAFRDAVAQDDQASDRTADARRDPPDSGRDPDIDAILHENDDLPDPRTRQQAARDAAAHDQADNGASAASHETPASGRDPDIEAILHENDRLPDPRTRQQAARDAATETSPADNDRAVRDQQARPGHDPLTGTASETTAKWADQPADGSSPHGEADREAQTLTVPDHAGHDLPVIIVQAGPEVRTLGDETPTGIGRKPTGGELEDLDGDRLSRADQFRKAFYKQADDITDVTEKNATSLEAFLGHRPSGGEAAVTGHYVMEAPQPPPADAGSIATGGLVLGILADRGIHWARQRVKQKRRSDE